MKKYNSLLKKLRVEFNIQQKDVFESTVSRSTFARMELGEAPISVDDLLHFIDNLGLSAAEFLYLGEVATPNATILGKLKEDLNNNFTNKKFLLEKYEEVLALRSKNFGYYNYFLAFHVALILNGLDTKIKTSKIIRELKKMYKDRTNFYGVDYSILNNFAVMIDDLHDLDFLVEKLFPIKEINFSDPFLFTIQSTIKNFLTRYLTERNYDRANFWTQQYNDLRNRIPSKLDGVTNLEIIYLEKVSEFLKTKNLETYMEAIKMIDLFEQMGLTEMKNHMIKNLVDLSKKEKFVIPGEIERKFEEIEYSEKTDRTSDISIKSE